MQCPEAEFWRQAIQSEINSLQHHGVWDPEPIPATSNMSIIKAKFIFKKKDVGTANEKYKARMVAQGFRQIEGIDCDQTFSGVVDKVSLRTVIHLIASHNMRCFKFDVSTAFCTPNLKKNYMCSYLQNFLMFQKETCIVSVKLSMDSNSPHAHGKLHSRLRSQDLVFLPILKIHVCFPDSGFFAHRSFRSTCRRWTFGCNRP